MISELEDGRKVNSRSYSLLGQERALNKLRVGAQVPVRESSGNSYQKFDIGTNIDCRFEERGGLLLLNTTLDLSELALADGVKDANFLPPVNRQLRAEVATVIVPGKPTVISTMDDPDSKREFQVEITATKVK